MRIRGPLLLPLWWTTSTSNLENRRRQRASRSVLSVKWKVHLNESRSVRSMNFVRSRQGRGRSTDDLNTRHFLYVVSKLRLVSFKEGLDQYRTGFVVLCCCCWKRTHPTDHEKRLRKLSFGLIHLAAQGRKAR